MQTRIWKITAIMPLRFGFSDVKKNHSRRFFSWTM